MRESLIPILRCPSCGEEGRWDLHVERRDHHEIREGSLGCQGCGRTRGVEAGIVDLLDDPPQFVVREAAGLERFAEVMRGDGWDRERVLELPYVKLGYWFDQAMAMEQLLEGRVPEVELSPGQRILDVGSNTCWASAAFAQRGLEVVALDIAKCEMQGLATADWWLEDRDIHFERVLSLMFDPALASDSFDVIWCSEVLHHNHRANLLRTFRELFRLLKPGGQLIVVNEPVRALRSPKLRPGAAVAEFEGHEHAYLRASYVRAARAAGFEVSLFGPSRFGPLTREEMGLSMRMSSLEGLQVALAHAVRRHRRLRAAYLAWKNYIDGVSLHMLATRPVSSDAQPAAGEG